MDRPQRPHARLPRAAPATKPSAELTRKIVVQAIGAVAAAMALLVVPAWRILAAAQFDNAVALQIARSADASQVLLGVGIATLPVAAAASALAAFFAFRREAGPALQAIRQKRQVADAAIYKLLGAVLATALVVALIPATPAVLFLFGAGLLSIADWPRRNPLSSAVLLHPVSRGSGILAGIGMLFVGLVGIAADDAPWLPSEQITSKSFSGIAYVLEASPSETILLVENDRSVLRVASDDIELRVTCNLSSREKTILQRLSRIPQSAPPCEHALP